MTTLWSRDREIQEIARKVPDPLSMKAGSGNETTAVHLLIGIRNFNLPLGTDYYNLCNVSTTMSGIELINFNLLAADYDSQ